MSGKWCLVGAVVLGFLVGREAEAATSLEVALADVVWDEPTLSLDADSNSAVSLAGETYATDASSLISCCTYEESACDDCCGAVDCGLGVNYCCPKWYATIGAVILERETPSAGTIIAANPALTPFSSAQDYNFDWEGGPEVALARRFENGYIVEGRYFGVDHSANVAIVTPGSFIGAGFTGPGGTSIAGRYLTTLDNAEINVRKQVGDRLTLLTGFRWLELQDEVDYTINAGVARGNYNYDNRLYGGQVGANFAVIEPGRRLMANIESKAGIFGNEVDGGIREFSGVNPIGSFLGSDTTTSFVGEINLTTGYRLSNHIAVRGGYQLLWIENVALASDAASRSLTNPSLLTTVSDDAGLFYHGATCGIDFVW